MSVRQPQFSHFRPRQHHQPGGFTLLEVVIALAVTAIALLCLVQLHLNTIRLVEMAGIRQTAALLAEQKLNELPASSNPPSSSLQGSETKNGVEYNWEIQIATPGSSQVSPPGLKQATIAISWPQGADRKSLAANRLFLAEGSRHD